MKYLTKTEFKEIVGRLQILRAGDSIQSRLELWSEGRFNFIDMEPGIIYKKVMGELPPPTIQYVPQADSPQIMNNLPPTIQYLTLKDSSINREWVGIYNSTTITTLNAPMNCEIYSISIPQFLHQSKFPTILTVNSGLTYWRAGRLQLNGYSDNTLKIYTYGSISPPFMNWVENPFN